VTAAGNYRIAWTVTLAGTVGANDANNFVLGVKNVNGILYLTPNVTSVNSGAVGSYQQVDVQASLNAGDIVFIKAGVHAGTAGSTYSGTITASDNDALSAGGNQGMPGNLPGGGGGGAVPDYTDNSGTDHPGSAAGNGGSGAALISWNGGTTPPVPNNVISFLLHVDPAGETDGAILARFVTFGTLQTIDFLYHTGGKLELKGYNGSTLLLDSGQLSAGADGKSLAIQVIFAPNGTSINFFMRSLDVNTGIITNFVSGTVTGISLGNVSDVFVNPTGSMNSGSATAMGWFVVQQYSDQLANLANMLNGFDGELVSVRLARLAAEEGIAFQLQGQDADTPQMGPQTDDTFMNLIQYCENADRGQVYEPRDVFGIGYRTRQNMQGQVPLIIDYSQAHLSPPFQPVSDDALSRNDIVISRYLGASATLQQLSGAMSIQDPPNGIGDYSYNETVYLYSDAQLANMIAWLLMLGTVSQYRFPSVNLDLRRGSLASLFFSIADQDIGDYFQITNVPNWLNADVINELVMGYTENISSTQWDFSPINTVPEDPYSTANPPVW